jgi:type I restriction enzyme M protein
LPGSIFAPYTPIATNLLFFDKTGPTNETWFYRMDLPENYKAFSKTKPVELKHMQPIIDWWNNRVEIKDKKEDKTLSDTWKSKKYTIAEIKALNYNLDQCGYPVKEEVILSPKDTMNKFISEREKLEKELDEKLIQIISLIGEM